MDRYERQMTLLAYKFSIHFYFLPCAAYVTTFTLATKSAVMYVIAGMAAAARTRYCQFFVHRQLVALVTTQFAMGSIQLEAGFVMIKIPCLPVAQIVAAFTICTQSPLVHILFLMARPAI